MSGFVVYWYSMNVNTSNRNWTSWHLFWCTVACWPFRTCTESCWCVWIRLFPLMPASCRTVPFVSVMKRAVVTRRCRPSLCKCALCGALVSARLLLCLYPSWVNIPKSSGLQGLLPFKLAPKVLFNQKKRVCYRPQSSAFLFSRAGGEWTLLICSSLPCEPFVTLVFTADFFWPTVSPDCSGFFDCSASVGAIEKPAVSSSLRLGNAPHVTPPYTNTFNITVGVGWVF